MLSAVLLVFMCACTCQSQGLQPVVIDTDIGSFMDDSFSVAFAVQSKFIQVKLIVTCTDDTTARAKVLAKFLTLMGRDDIPIGVGLKNDNLTNHDLFEWGADFDLSQYRGGVFEDGIEKMAGVIQDSSTPVDIIAIGPMTNFPTLLSKYPSVVTNSKVYAMAGSVYKGYLNSSTPSSEYNVRLCPWCMSLLLKADWFVQITPLDTCGTFTLNAKLFESMIATTNNVSLALTSQLFYYCLVHEDACVFYGNDIHYPILFDVVATLLTLPVSDKFLSITTLPLTVKDDGYTVVDKENGTTTSVALSWQPNEGESYFMNYVVEVLRDHGQ